MREVTIMDPVGSEELDARPLADIPSAEIPSTDIPLPPSIGALLAAMRKQIETTCRKCGETIPGTVRRRFCSDACKQSHWRQRKAAAQGGPTPPVD